MAKPEEGRVNWADFSDDEETANNPQAHDATASKVVEE